MAGPRVFAPGNKNSNKNNMTKRSKIYTIIICLIILVPVLIQLSAQTKYGYDFCVPRGTMHEGDPFIRGDEYCQFLFTKFYHRSY